VLALAAIGPLAGATPDSATNSVGNPHAEANTLGGNGGLTSSATHSVTASPLASTAPVAALTVTPATGTAPLAVTADASASTDAESNIASYGFNFGDGTVLDPQASAKVQHTFSLAGSYTVAVTVTDPGGLTGTARQSVIANAGASDPVIAAAGDISCVNADIGSSCHQDRTALELGRIRPQQIIPLGDLQYGGTTAAADFQASYGPFANGQSSWGDYKAITHPTVGSHEYNGDTITKAYSDYWLGVGVNGNRGSPVGDRNENFYAENLGTWRVYHLNSQHGYQAASVQDQWFKADLAANTGKCTLVTWHHPRFSSGIHGNQAQAIALFQSAYNGGADVLLSGNDHLYERFAPQNPSGALDTVRGIRQFVVGTGGKGLYTWGTIQPNSEVRNNTTYGVIKLTLHSAGYDWEFRSENDIVIDSGSQRCHS